MNSRQTPSGIGSTLTLDALATLASTDRGDELRRRQFFLLTRRKQIEAIQRLAASGYSDASISRCTGLAPDQVCRLLGNREPRHAV
jgi:hypothetical protein